MDPSKETFRKKWDQFQNTRLRRGHFRNPNQTAPIFDRRADGGAALYVPFEHDPKQILEVCWHLLGSSHQHAWENYVTRLKAGECDRFFDNIHLNDRDWIELEAVIGASQETRINQLQPAFLALRRYQIFDLGVEQFRSEFNSRNDNLDEIADWAGIKRVVLDMVIKVSSLNFDDERQLPVVETLGVSIPDWQRARRDFREKPRSFFVYSRVVQRLACKYCCLSKNSFCPW